MATKTTVLDLPAVTELEENDVKYIVRGTGTDRDKQITELDAANSPNFRRPLNNFITSISGVTDAHTEDLYFLGPTLLGGTEAVRSAFIKGRYSTNDSNQQYTFEMQIRAYTGASPNTKEIIISEHGWKDIVRPFDIKIYNDGSSAYKVYFVIDSATEFSMIEAYYHMCEFESTPIEPYSSGYLQENKIRLFQLANENNTTSFDPTESGNYTDVTSDFSILSANFNELAVNKKSLLGGGYVRNTHTQDLYWEIARGSTSSFPQAVLLEFSASATQKQTGKIFFNFATKTYEFVLESIDGASAANELQKYFDIKIYKNGTFIIVYFVVPTTITFARYLLKAQYIKSGAPNTAIFPYNNSVSLNNSINAVEAIPFLVNNETTAFTAPTGYTDDTSNWKILQNKSLFDIQSFPISEGIGINEKYYGYTNTWAGGLPRILKLGTLSDDNGKGFIVSVYTKRILGTTAANGRSTYTKYIVQKNDDADYSVNYHESTSDNSSDIYKPKLRIVENDSTKTSEIFIYLDNTSIAICGIEIEYNYGLITEFAADDTNFGSPAGYTERWDYDNDSAVGTFIIGNELEVKGGIIVENELEVKGGIIVENELEAKSGIIVENELEVKGGIISNSGDITSGIKTAVFNIGNWNMDTTGSINLYLTNMNLSSTDKLISVNVLIRADNDLSVIPLDHFDSGLSAISGYWSYDSSTFPNKIILTRTSGGLFNSVLFDSTSFNRGKVIIQYID